MAQKLTTQSIGEWFGDAHAWAKSGLDQFIEQRVKLCIEQGQYPDMDDPAAVKHALLREAFYLIHAVFTSVEHSPAGLDAVRMSRQEIKGRSPLIPSFRELMADYLGVPNPFRRSDDPKVGGPEPMQDAEVPGE